MLPVFFFADVETVDTNAALVNAELGETSRPLHEPVTADLPA